MSTPQRPATTYDSAHDTDGQEHAADPAEPDRLGWRHRPGRTAYRRGRLWPNGSTARLREDVLGALGVLKVATADQLQRLLRPGAGSNTVIRQGLRDLALHNLVASDGNTKTGHKTWRLEGTAGLEAAGQVLGLFRSEMGSTARGAGRTGAQHAMAVNETIAAFVLGGTAEDAPGGVGRLADWATEVEYVLPGGRRKVRPDAVWQAPEIGVPVLMVEVDRSTLSTERLAGKFTAYRELFRTKVKSNDPALADEEPADRMVHWWLRDWPGHTRPGYPPVALVVTDASPLALANRQEKVSALARDAWGGGWWTRRDDNADGDGWREYDDAVPVIATTLELLAEHGPLGPVWWRYGRNDARYSLLDALESPDTREAYDERQAAREEKRRQDHRDLMETLACADCGNVPLQESTSEYGPKGRLRWTRRPGGRCWDCEEKDLERREKEKKAKAKQQLEAARAANAKLRRCWTCRGSIGGKAGSFLELTEEAGPNRLECPSCVSDRGDQELGPLVLPLPTLRETLAARVSTPADPWWNLRVQHTTLYPAKDRR
ncbi:replication-relaxation family protein [Kitasatospora sp. NPDC059973]|uniref:replication-relaxation family protein n=1 Tax=Kitasatospora sp. NPDC059973 TaxID=3347020 RepID=UPI003697EE6D